MNSNPKGVSLDHHVADYLKKTVLMRTIRLELCYDGAKFAGWQVQPSQPKVRTIQGELQRAIFSITGKASAATGSGRTDAGVHALCQTAAFQTDSDLPAERFVPALNSALPPEIRVLRSRQVNDDFNPILDVVRKRYRYLLSDSRPIFPFLSHHVWFVLGRLDFDRMVQAAAFLPGRQDFAAFQTTGSERSTTVRTIFDAVVRRLDFPALWFAPAHERGEIALPEIYAIEVEADGFLYNMVRAIAGTLAAIGQRRERFESPERMRAIIESKNRALAGPTAPAHGLTMLGAVYAVDTQLESLHPPVAFGKRGME